MEGKVKLQPVLIDFPQTVSTNHANAQYYFDRDVACIRRYFERRFKYVSNEPGPFFADALKSADSERRLDIEVEASGFSKKMGKDLERFIEANGGGQTEADAQVDGGEPGDGQSDEGEDDDDDGEAEDEGDEGLVEEIAEDELVEEMHDLSTDDRTAHKPFDSTAFGLEPLDLPQDPDVVTEKLRTKKRATGWAI